MRHASWGPTVIALHLLTGSTVMGQVPTPESPNPQIRTVGTASRSVPPDYAILTFNFTGEGATPLEAGQRVAARSDSLRRALQRLGIPKDSITAPSRWYWGRNRMEKTFATRYVTVPNGPPGATWQKQDTLYRGNDALTLRIYDLSKVGPAIDTAYAYGVIDVGELTFRASNTTVARDELLRAAARDARAQAIAIAEASGAKLGRLLGLSTEPDARLDPFSQAISVRSGSVDGAAATGTRVAAPSISLGATVYGRWEVVPVQ